MGCTREQNVLNCQSCQVIMIIIVTYKFAVSGAAIGAAGKGGRWDIALALLEGSCPNFICPFRIVSAACPNCFCMVSGVSVLLLRCKTTSVHTCHQMSRYICPCERPESDSSALWSCNFRLCDPKDLRNLVNGLLPQNWMSCKERSDNQVETGSPFT
jgi:hypothetical protein